jgi:succinoglycan biosynthesis transport protein ExoP
LPEEESSSSLNESLAQVSRLLGRRRWWILLPACSITLVSLAVILKLPNRYTSEATLLVVRQQVPERYVVPNSTTDTSAALQAIRQDVLSRTRLLKIIDDFGLYGKNKKRLAPETLVEQMLLNIDIEPIIDNPNRKDFDALKISFVAEDPVLAQGVTSNLTSLFINENLRTREEQATGTTNFLHQQVETKGKQLQEQEQRLSDFKMQHVGELPEQQAGNLGILSGLQSQLQNTTANLSRAQEQRVYLETLLSSYKRQVSPTGLPFMTQQGSPVVVNRPLSPVETAHNEVVRLQSARAAMFGRGWTSQHPDVMKIERELSKAEEALNHLKATTPTPQKEEAAPASTRASTAPPPVEATDDPAVAQVKSQFEANRVEIGNLSSEEKRLKASISGYETRLNQTPIREQQQAGIARETEALRQDYATLQKKEQESQLATNLEKQQGGQQFRLVDAPNLPLVPSSPKRLKLSLGATAAGFALGLALAFFMEMKDTSFYTEKDLIRHLAPPFVMGIPLLPTPMEERQRKWRSAFQWVAASVMVMAVLAAELYVYKRG